MKMKKIFFTLIVTLLLISCKKETSSPNNTTSNTNVIHTDTTKTSSEVSIAGFDCAGVIISGILTKNKVVTNVTATISYSGGNGKSYSTKSHASTGVTGLIATLQEGNLSNGIGKLIYTISGTPTTAGTTNFAIAFGGKSCAINFNVEDVSNTIGKLGPNITDIDGNLYKTVYIGTQQWMAENLKVSKYSDGSTISNITNENSWYYDTTGAWSYYKNNEDNNAKYGKLYNWYAVSQSTNGNKNLCPTGWHVPSDAEWTVLTNYLGGESLAGGKMKEAGLLSWKSPNTSATNISLFSALPGGERADWGAWGAEYLIGKTGSWWSSTESSGGSPWFRYLHSYDGEVGRSTEYKYFGFSIRCLKD